MTRAWVVIDPAGDCEISFRYDATAVEMLKSAVPSFGRRWVSSGKTWEVTRAYTETALTALRLHFGTTAVEVTDLRPPKVKPATPITSRPWAAALFERLPDRLAEPAYRALTKVLHPDVGGDGRVMQELNDTYQRRRKGGAA